MRSPEAEAALQNLQVRIEILNRELSIDKTTMQAIMIEMSDYEPPRTATPQEVADSMFARYENIARQIKPTP